MYYNRKFTGVKWYYGTKDTSYLVEMVPLIYKFIDALNVKQEDIIFLGSSGGGYAAIYLANLFDGATAMALSPQYDIGHLNPRDNKIFMEEYGIDLLDDDKFNRNVLKITSKNSLFFLVENSLSEMDWDKQFLPFCKRHGIIPKYGISQYDNIITWVHASNGIDTHTSNPEKCGIVILEFLLNEYRRGVDINLFNKFSFVLNEILNDKYELIRSNNLLKNKVNVLSAINCDVFLKTFHNTYLCYNIKNKKLISTNTCNDENIKVIAKVYSDYCTLQVYNMNKCMFISDIYGEITDKIVKFNYTSNDDNSISILYNDKYLSARPNGNVIIIDNNRNWEHFYFEKIK